MKKYIINTSISLLLTISCCFAQNTKDYTVGYLGKRFLINGYVQANVVPFAYDGILPYKENAFLGSIAAAWNIESEYLLSRRWGVTLGLMTYRFATSPYQISNSFEVDKYRMRNISLGIKNYLRREGGLAPVGFYQHLRVQYMTGAHELFILTNDNLSLASEESLNGKGLFCYGVGTNFGFGALPLFSVGADFIFPFKNAFMTEFEDGLSNIMFTARIGIVVPIK